MPDSIAIQAIRSVVERVNRFAPSENYCIFSDGTIRESDGAEVLMGGADGVAPSQEPLHDYRMNLLLAIRTAVRTGRESAFIESVNSHMLYAVQPLVEYVPPVADTLVISSTRPLEFESGASTISYIMTDFQINLVLPKLEE